tara:strand:+ start:121 stop:423 length:303 start_codon:yes stop_codon:yes gene_type:complete
MTKINHLVEQNIERYESHLKHIDELFEQASKGKNASPEHADIHAQIANLKGERDKFAKHIDGLKQGTIADFEENMIEKSGPMGIWDALALQLEKLVERIK